MHCVRRDEYIKGYRKYKYFDPYFTIGIGMLNGKRTRMPIQQLLCRGRTFEKGASRQASLRAELRRVRYVVGNKFILDGDAVVNTANEA